MSWNFHILYTKNSLFGLQFYFPSWISCCRSEVIYIFLRTEIKDLKSKQSETKLFFLVFFDKFKRIYGLCYYLLNLYTLCNCYYLILDLPIIHLSHYEDTIIMLYIISNINGLSMLRWLFLGNKTKSYYDGCRGY